MLIAAMVFLSAGARAPKAGVWVKALQELVDCRKLTEGAARLSCYDIAVAHVELALNSGEIVAVDQQQVATAKRQAFGLWLPSLSIFDHSGQPAALETLTDAVERAYQRSDGRWVLELETGAIWEQTDLEPVRREPQKGSKAEIRKASLGTFFINLDGQRAIRAKRIK
ncbi:MAG: hypothetical protein ABJB10_14960 [Mesorhizobium sp.]